MTRIQSPRRVARASSALKLQPAAALAGRVYELAGMEFNLNSPKQLGQVLFLPPNVAGWDWGKAWINTNTLLTRYNVAGVITKGVGFLPLLVLIPYAFARRRGWPVAAVAWTDRIEGT